MKKLCIIIVLAVAGAAWGQPRPSMVGSEYDKFKNTYTLKTGEVSLSGGPNIQGSRFIRFIALYDGDQINATPIMLSIMVFSSASEWQYLRHRDDPMIVVADNKRYSFSSLGTNSDIGTGGDRVHVYEIMLYAIDADSLLALSKSQRIECQVGIDEFVWNKEVKNNLLAFGYKTKLIEPPPETIPFESTNDREVLAAAVDAAKSNLRLTEVASMVRVYKLPELAVKEKEIEDLERQKRDLFGQARLDSSAQWLKAKSELNERCKSLMEKDEDLLLAREMLRSAENELTVAKEVYDANPTTRPSIGWVSR
jgi:hypothetical protein